MTSQKTVTSSAVAIYLSRGELEGCGIQTEINGETAKKLVRDSLVAQGELPWKDMELELFSNGDTMLILARPGVFQPYCFRFEDFEGLMTAVKECAFDMPSTLTYAEGKYFLFLRAGTDGMPASMYEFGEAQPCPDGFMTHTAEQGGMIIQAGAITLLKKIFG